MIILSLVPVALFVPNDGPAYWGGIPMRVQADLFRSSVFTSLIHWGMAIVAISVWLATFAGLK